MSQIHQKGNSDRFSSRECNSALYSLINITSVTTGCSEETNLFSNNTACFKTFSRERKYLARIAWINLMYINHVLSCNNQSIISCNREYP